jgi:hypothetical protein
LVIKGCDQLPQALVFRHPVAHLSVGVKNGPMVSSAECVTNLVE